MLRHVMKRTRKSITLGACAALATGVAGCFPFIQSDTAQQSAPMADVRVDTELCGSPLLGLIYSSGGGVESLDDLCLDKDEAFDFHYTDDITELGMPLPGQMLVSYRVPKGATAPETLTADAEVIHFSDWWSWLMAEGSGEGTGTGTTGGRPDPAPLRKHTMTFTRSADLDEKLPAHWEKNDPENETDGIDILDDDEQIVSYISDVVPGAVVGDWELDAPFGLPASKRPYSGPFNHLSMAGWRAAMTEELEPPLEERRALRAAGVNTRGLGGALGELDPARAINCDFGGRLLPLLGQAPRSLRGTDEEPEAADVTICPLPQPKINADRENDEPLLDFAGAFTGTDTAVRDLDVRGGGETFAEQGTTARVPFKLASSGAPGGKLDLVASVSPAIPGVGELKSQIDFPGTGTTNRDVEIKLPADAPSRTYEVTLRAVSQSGDVRSAKAGLVVLAKKATEQQAPAGTVRAKQASGRGNVFMDADGYLRFGNVCGECSVDGLVPFGSVGDKSAKAAQARSGRLLRVARAGKLRGKQGVRTKVRVKLFPKAQRSLRRGRKLTGVLVFRNGKSTAPQVRKVIFRTRAKK